MILLAASRLTLTSGKREENEARHHHYDVQHQIDTRYREAGACDDKQQANHRGGLELAHHSDL